MPAPRSALTIAFSVWKALFLREALTRLFASRAAWFWLLAEPVFHLTFLAFVFSVIRVRSVGGIDTAIWLLLGLLGFFAFRRTATQTLSAIKANQALFAYRQVLPADTVLARGALEGTLMVGVIAVVWLGTALAGLGGMPADPLGVFVAFAALWLLGLGYGLVASVVVELIPEAGRVLGLAMMPLYLLSGVLYPLASVPPPWREWLMLNPVAHGLEAARLAFAPHYHAAPELAPGYLGLWVLGLGFLGLALHRRYAPRLTAA